MRGARGYMEAEEPVTMSAFIRLSIFFIAAVFALVIALALLKLFIALASIAFVVIAAIFVFHFGRALFRRMTARRQPQMLGSGSVEIL